MLCWTLRTLTRIPERANRYVVQWPTAYRFFLPLLCADKPYHPCFLLDIAFPQVPRGTVHFPLGSDSLLTNKPHFAEPRTYPANLRKRPS